MKASLARARTFGGKVSAAALALWAVPAVAYASSQWDVNKLMDQVMPIIRTIFPIVLFVAVIRVMWEGVKMITGLNAVGGTSSETGSAGAKKVLFTSIQGILWILGSWIIIELAAALAQNMLGVKI